MTRKQAEKRVRELRAEIREHDRLYYVQASPRISDRAYDRLFDELKSLEAKYPDLVTPDSPTQRVSGRPIEGFRHVHHSPRMLSIDNTYDESQLREFDARVAKGLEGEPYEYVVDPKIDGVAVALRYERGRLVLAATRGDGVTGDDVTHAIREIRAIPQGLAGRVGDWPDVLEVRGEVYWPVESFRRFNLARRDAGEEAFANPRNATAGTLKRLDPSGIAQRGLGFSAHGYGVIEPNRFERFSELLDALARWGIPAGEGVSVESTIEGVLEQVHRWAQKRHELAYETDGLVVKVDRLDQRERLGATSRYPRWCIAYKFAAEQAESVLRRVDYQVGKLGTITPRAVMDPMLLSGTTVRHASLHNFDQVQRLGGKRGLRIGDRVVVEKAGEIIPQIVAVKEPCGRGEVVKPPAACPVCNGRVERDEGGVYLRCVNPDCPAQLKERLVHFCGRDQMDIEGAGRVLLETLVDKGWVKSLPDLFKLEEAELAELELGTDEKARQEKIVRRLGPKNAANLVRALERCKAQPLDRVLAGLCIPLVGRTTARLLAEAFGDWGSLAKATPEQMQGIDGVGPEVAQSVFEFFHEHGGKALLEKLERVGLEMRPLKKVAAAGGVDSALAGKTVVVTGTLERFSRNEINEKIESLGGHVSSSVSGTTDFVVAGDKPGSKLAKARALGVRVLDEAELVRMIGE